MSTSLPSPLNFQPSPSYSGLPTRTSEDEDTGPPGFRDHSLAQHPLTVVIQNGKGKKMWKFHSTPRKSKDLTDQTCTLPPGQKHGWKPRTMRLPVLASIGLVSILLAVILEFLAQKSQRNGGIAFGKTTKDISAGYQFLYNFFPTMIVVIYGMAWSWIDLDVKRLEPWLALSELNGALAERSLFIQYPLEFIPYAPFKSLRKGQMRVFYSSLIILLVSMVIVPLQSAAISTETVNVVRKSLATTTKDFIPIGSQSPNLDQSVLYTLYTSTWLNQSLPPFTTETYSLVPFDIQLDDIDNATPMGNLTSTTTKIWTNLTCTPAEHDILYPRPNSMSWYSNGYGCNVTNMTLETSSPGTYRFWWIAYQDSPYASYSLKPYGNDCPVSVGEHLFLLSWSHRSRITPQDFVANYMFCESSYYTQEVEATVSYPGFAPLSYAPIGELQRLDDKIFNISAFEYLVGSGVLMDDQPRDFLLSHYIEQYPQVLGLYEDVMSPIDTMVGFALGRNKDLSIDAYEDTGILAEAFTGAQRSLFAISVSHLLSQNTSQKSREAEYKFATGAITVSRPYSLAVEVLLCFVTVLTFLLAWNCETCTSMLSSSPSSISNMATTFHNKHELTEFSQHGNLSEKSLSQAFKGKRFRFLCGCKSNTGQPVLERLYNQDDIVLSRNTPFGGSLKIEPGQGLFQPIRPLAFRPIAGITFSIVLLASFVSLIWLKILQQEKNGIPEPSRNKNVLLLLFSYIPTIFATSLELCLTFINRFLCVLQPYKDLYLGNRPAKRTIEARYTSVPPQLVLLRAAKSRHFLLFVVCIMALIANILPVAFSGLFSSSPTPKIIAQNFTQSITHVFNESSCTNFTDNFQAVKYRDPSYVLLLNLTSGSELVPWATMDYYFQPFDVPHTSNNSFTATTRGYTVNPGCNAARTNYSVGTALPNFSYNLSADHLSRNEACFLNYSITGAPIFRTPAKTPYGPAAGEGMTVLWDKSPECGHFFIYFFARWTNLGSGSGLINSTNMVCRPYFTTAEFNVTVDAVGHIKSFNQLETLEAVTDKQGRNASLAFLKKMDQQLSDWSAHTTNLTQNEIGHLMKAYVRNDTWFQPNATIPNMNETFPIFEKIYKAQISIALALNPQLFEFDTERITAGTQMILESRMFMSDIALYISLSILVLDFFVTLWVYIKGVTFYLPRLPSTLGSLLAFVAMNRSLETYSSKSDAQKTFSFGRYVGIDGKMQLGIEEDPYVVKVADAEVKGWLSSLPSRLKLRNRDKGEVATAFI